MLFRHLFLIKDSSPLGVWNFPEKMYWTTHVFEQGWFFGGMGAQPDIRTTSRPVWSYDYL